MARGRPRAPSQASDEALLREVGRGDPVACRVLVERHLPALVGFSGRVLGNAAEAEDVAQDAFLRVWERTRQWRPPPRRFRPWLYRIAYNLCIDRLRRSRDLPWPEGLDPPDPRADAGRRLERQALDRWLAGALGSLPERQRAALALCHEQGLSGNDAAAVMGIRVDALESLLARARRTLRQRAMAELPDFLHDRPED